MGFVGCVCVPWGRDSRGLGLFWSGSKQVNLKHYSYHHIDVEVVQPDMNDPWRIMGVYGYACAEDKALTWELTLALGQQSSLPWLMVGDFNEIICNEEKFGGPRLQIGLMLRLEKL